LDLGPLGFGAAAGIYIRGARMPNKRDTKAKSKKIDGPFYPWLIDMGLSPAMQRVRMNSDAVNLFSLFISKFSKRNDGKDLSVTYAETRNFMSPHTHRKAALWLMAFGFLHCVRAGRVEKLTSIYELSAKWKRLSTQPEKLNRISELLRRHETVRRIPKGRVKVRKGRSANCRKRMVLRQIEMRALQQ
jgi:hypothetical protein